MFSEKSIVKNGKYQVGSGRIVTVTQDTPFINNGVSHPEKNVNIKNGKMPSRDKIQKRRPPAIESSTV